MPAHSSGAAACQRDRVGDAQHVVLVDDDRAAVSALRRLAVAADTVVGADHPWVVAVLLLACEAVLALAARVDETADADAVADLELGDVRSDLADDAGDLVTGNHRVRRLSPHSPRTVWMSE